MKRRLTALPHGLLPVLGLLLGLSAPCICLAQAKSLGDDLDPKVQAEIDYASRLLDMELPEFSDMVLQRLNDPSAKNMMKVLRMKALLMRGKFDEAKGLISGETGEAAQAMRLALADGFFMWGKYPQAQEIYSDFFGKYPGGPSESMNKFYMEAAYKYAQMLLFMKKDGEALDAYNLVMKAKLKKEEQRQMLGESAEIMLRIADEKPESRDKLLPEVEKIISKLLWVQDLWWAKAIVYQAHLKMLRNDVAGATKLIGEYRKDLKGMDDQLRQAAAEQGTDPVILLKLSPMAEVRYMIASLQLKEAERLLAEDRDRNRDQIGTLLVGPRVESGVRDMEQGALKNFYEVFINYPSTQWAPKAGGYARRTKEILESLGAKPNITITDEQWNKVATLQFQEARSLLSQQQYEKALESYTTVINVFPESEMSIDAIGEMVRCHIELCTDSNSAATAAIYAPMFAGYLAERFCMNSNLATKAGDQIVRIAEFFGERGNKDAQDVLYAKFFTLYSKHSRAPSIQYRFGDNQLRRENYAEALNYFKQVADNYPDLPLGLDALFRVAYCYGKMDDTTNEIASLEAFVAGLEKQDKGNSFLMVEARNRIAYANWKSGKATHLVALKQFNDLIVALDQPNPRFVHGDEDKKRGQEILESAMFFKASGFASLAEPAERIKDFRTAAFAGFTDLLKRFPKSSFAPRALGQMAALFIADGQADKATDAIRQLERDYPDSTEAKNSTFMMAKALLDMGFKEQAIKYFRKMFEGGGAFTESQIVSAATELMKSKEYEIALNGFERVLAGVSTNRSLLELSLLGKGKCLTELGRYQDAVTALVSFTNAYPRTANLIDASLYIGRAYSEVAASEPDRQKRIRTFNLGVKALKEGMKYERSQSGRARMTYEAGRIQERQAEGELKSGTKEQAKAYQGQAVATYRTLSLTYSPAEPGVAEWMQKADAQSVPLLMTLGMEKDAYEVCETHLKRFAGSSQAQQMRRLRNQLAATLAGRGELPSSAGVIEDVGSTNALATTNIASAVVNAASNATNVAGAVTNAPAPTAN